MYRKVLTSASSLPVHRGCSRPDRIIESSPWKLGTPSKKGKDSWSLIVSAGLVGLCYFFVVSAETRRFVKARLEPSVQRWRPSGPPEVATPKNRAYIGRCDSEFDHIRRMLLGGDFADPSKTVRLRGLAAAKFIPGKGFCDSFVSTGRYEVYTERYLEDSRTFFLDVSLALPESAGGYSLFYASDGTDLILDEEIDTAWNARTPLLAHNLSSRNTTNVIFIPDAHFIKTRAFRELIDHARKEGEKWESRQPVVFWRGSSTSAPSYCREGEVLTTPSQLRLEDVQCGKIPRVQMALMSKNIPALDAKVVRATTCCEGNEQQLTDAGVMDNWVPENEWVKFRGILDMDGVVNAWGLFWRLGTGSVVFRVNGRYTNLYVRQLRPWVHYIPVNEDLSDLEEKVALVTSNDTETVRNLSQIASNAQDLVTEITYQAEVARVRDELLRVWGFS